MRIKISCAVCWAYLCVRFSFLPCPGKVGPLGHHGEAELLLLLCGFWEGWCDGQGQIRVRWDLGHWTHIAILMACLIPLGQGSLREQLSTCLFILTQLGALIHEEGSPEHEGTFNCVVSSYPVWFDLCKTAGAMLELIEINGSPGICRERDSEQTKQVSISLPGPDRLLCLASQHY